MNHGVKLTPNVVTNLGVGYSSGKTTTQLSEEFKLSRATVCRGLRKYGIEPERKDEFFQNNDFTDEVKLNILTEFKEGVTLKELCQKYDTTYFSLVRLLEAEGVYRKKKIAYSYKVSKVINMIDGVKRILSTEDQLKLCQEWEEGPFSRDELAAEYGVHIDTVNAAIRRHNAGTKKYVAAEIIEIFCEEFASKQYNLYDIAKIYGLDAATVRYWLTKRNLLDTITPVAQAEHTKQILSRAEFKKKAREDLWDFYARIKEVALDPATDSKTVVLAASKAIELIIGKPREEPEEESEKGSKTNRILGLVGNDKLFNK